MNHRQNFVVPTARGAWPQRLGVAVAAATLIVLLGRCAVQSAEADTDPLASMSPAEQAAFQAGRVVAHAELSGAVTAAYDAGVADGIAKAASAVQP